MGKGFTALKFGLTREGYVDNVLKVHIALQGGDTDISVPCGGHIKQAEIVLPTHCSSLCFKLGVGEAWGEGWNEGRVVKSEKRCVATIGKEAIFSPADNPCNQVKISNTNHYPCRMVVH